MSPFKTIQSEVEAEVIEKKSRFIAHVAPVCSEEEALTFLERIKKENSAARHNVYAYILQSGRTRYSDDGEPAQTSGLPTFQVLEHAGLSNVICVTTRYFGGVLLGTGGLVRAYTQAAQAALFVANIVQIQNVVDISVVLEYADYDNALKAAEEKGARVQGSQYSSVVEITLRVLEADSECVQKALIDATHGRAKLSVTDPFSAAF